MKAALLLLLFTLLISCGPGIKDGSEHLSGDYYFTHSGGHQKYIERKINWYTFEIVIPAKVEEFLVVGDTIYISRIAIKYTVKNNSVTSTEGKTCEYWSIHSADNSIYGPYTFDYVQTQSEWKSLRNSTESTDFEGVNSRCALRDIGYSQ